MKRYKCLFTVKYIILTASIYFLQHIQVSMEKGFYFKDAQCVLMPQWEEDQGLAELREAFGSGSLPEGTYFIDGDNFTYCPTCAYHINLDEVTVYGSFTSNVSNHAPVSTSYSDIWFRSPVSPSWYYWDHGSSSSGTGEWKPDPNGLLTMTDLQRNSAFADVVENAEGKPYLEGENGPDKFDCSGLIVYALRSLNPNFGDYSADQLYNLFTVPTTSTAKGTLVFYDYESNGTMNHVTTLLGDGQMIHPSSGAGTVLKVSSTYLDSYNEGRDGTKYYRKINWSSVIAE